MDTPESPSQSPQSPEEEDKGISDSELLDSPDEEEDRVISDSELVEENGGLDEDNDDEEEELGESRAGGLGLEVEGEEEEDEDEVVPDFVSEADEEEALGGVGQEDEAIMLMEGDEEGAQPDPQEEEEEQRAQGEEREDGVIDTPQSPDSEPEQSRRLAAGDGYAGLSRGDAAPPPPKPSAQEEEEEEEEEEDKSKEDEEDERRMAEERRRARELKDDSASVSRELDEHELDYDEEVPEEPSVPAHDDEEEDEDAKAEEDDEEESQDKAATAAATAAAKKKEKKPILPPSPKEGEGRRAEEARGPDRTRRDSFRDKKKEEDDGEIDEGEIDDDDLEEGEVKDPSDRKIRPRPICRFFIKGNCTWGMNCRFIHPGVNDKGNYSLISKPDLFSPNGAPPGGPHPLIPNNPWAAPAVEELPPPPPPVEPPVESAWERGLRHAKEVLKKATIRKEQEPDFEEKRFNVTIGEDERDFDKENDFFRERNYRVIRE